MDPEQMQWAAERAANRSGQSSEWRTAETIGAFALGFAAAQERKAARAAAIGYWAWDEEAEEWVWVSSAPPVAAPAQTFLRRLLHGVYVGAWAYFLVMVVGALVLWAVTSWLFPPTVH